MAIRVCINGFGRIGRAIFRNLMKTQEFDVVLINDINPDPESVAYSFNYDSVYGRASDDNALITTGGDQLTVSSLDRPIKLSSERAIGKVPLSNVDLVIDASGVSNNGDEVREVLNRNTELLFIATHDHPAAENLVVIGGNCRELPLGSYRFISSGICDANAIAPVLTTLNRHNEIISGHITTVHPWLNYQNLSDGPSFSWAHPGETYAHYPLGRAAVGNVIPKPTTAVEVSLRAASGVSANLGSFSYRVPTAIVGSADLFLNFRNNFDTSILLEWLRQESSKYSPELFSFNADPLVSTDFVGSTEAAIVDLRWTYVRDRFAHIVLWYDNEHGYAAKTVDVAKLFCSSRNEG